MLQPVSFTVDCSADRGPLPRLWDSTGFTPAPILLRPAMRQAIQWYGSIPGRGLRHCRIHYLLDLVQVKGLELGTPVYDWSRLDRGIDLLVDAGMAPFFELMGDPTGPRIEPHAPGQYGPAQAGKVARGWFTDFLRPEQRAAWRRLVADVARHCIERYGRDEVRSWHWEVWNEPDGGWFGQGAEQLVAYTIACAEGLRDADPELRFGGPGTARTMSQALLDWAAGVDAAGIRLDFISIHEKGGFAHPEQPDIDTPAIIERTRRFIAHLRAHHPRLAALPFYNDECDPIIGWAHLHARHATPWYAGWALRVIDLHLRTLVDEDGVDLRNLGNDHGFIGSWGQRSMLARIEIPAEGQQSMFPRAFAGEDGRFLLVKKPIFNAHVLLSLLGGRRVASSAAGHPDAGALATADDDAIAVAYYHHRDRGDHGGFAVPATLVIDHVPPGPWRLVHERIDDGSPHPYAVSCQGPGDPPGPELQRRLLASGEIARLDGPRTVEPVDGRIELSCELPLPSMGLVLLVRDPGAAPAAVDGLRAEHWPGISADEQIMLRWNHLPARTLSTYEVERRDGDAWTRIDPGTRCAAWCDLRTPTLGADYRVRAVDLWGRAGPWSAVLRT